ncbi:hypothetical protein TRFO_42579 [Tritrichomonas foetus]|uniref:Saposin B-type domain-containing protein n=1 Tax=Tritrichomonas foetus TaxID=1144522 RepID=A0A1J4L0G2_9EUKA|nr:hypothetical protein TRFO_42579 [Tritrichomonas foetus]|eukprot:OHT15341.1 hypothetical protein TRFO_42579 [Tritrichomonas foetus]
MKDARTISQIVKSIEKLCEYVDENVRDVCQTIIVDNVPKIIAYIEQLMEAHDVCWEIGICK